MSDERFNDRIQEYFDEIRRISTASFVLTDQKKGLKDNLENVFYRKILIDQKERSR